MSNPTADSAKLRTKLAKDYRQLPALEQKIVELFSVIYEPISRTSFVECLNYIGARDRNYKPFTTSTLKPYIDGLLAAGLLVQPVNQGPQCHPLLVEIATRDAVQAERFETLAKAVQEKLPVNTRFASSSRYFERASQLIREIRIGLYRQDINFINKQLEDYHKYGHSKDKISIEDIFDRVCNNPFDADWFRTLPQGLYESGLSNILINATLKLTSVDEAFTLLFEECSKPGGRGSDYLYLILTEQLLLRGRLLEAQQSLERLSDSCLR